ncbi:sensor histidine kinase [Methylovulum psychrotolerans]|uniref:histidine kinase n=1 Tax=Methylovulum psychrotolerans TaxID=1704499 RepID=A0A2S5CPX5_9GAMM|nr:GAF domain-containing sensor histidine kinase [Methylovulum psychrotolerans]POZ52848.1 histidine kinase [Methylovulum psychrotolerans]
MANLNTESLSDLVTTALAQNELSGLSAIIEVIARSVNAPIAILWQVAPAPIEDTLFIVAEWFEKRQKVPTHFHTLHRQSATITYKALTTGQCQANNEIYAQDGTFLAEFGIQSLLSIPLMMEKNKDGKNNHALTLYWTREGQLSRSENDAESQKAQFLASFLLDFYRTLTDKVSYALLEQCNKTLEQLSSTSVDCKQVFKEICGLISNKLQAHDVTIYLCETTSKGNGDYCLQASTLNEPVAVKPKRVLGNKTNLIDWVVTEGRCVRIFDLQLYEKYKMAYAQKYSGLALGEDTLNWWKNTSRRLLDIPIDKELPPISVLAVPIMSGDRLLGVIRCGLTKRSPYYFSDQEKQLLVLVANQISQAWSHRLNLRNIEEENRTLTSFVSNLASLNTYVHNIIKNHEKLDQNVFIETLRNDTFTSALVRLQQSINNVNIAAIRLVAEDENGQYLYFAHIFGDVTAPIGKRFYLHETKADNQPAKAGVLVVKTGEPYIMKDKSDSYYPLQSFDAESMVIAPIKIGSEVIGVIDVRSDIPNGLSSSVVSIMEAIGLQLGLYNDLFDKVVKLKQSVHDLKTEQKNQTQTYEDFAHQLKTPMQQLNSRVRSLINTYEDDSLPRELAYLRGSAAKAQRVSLGIRLFADLTKGKPLRPDLIVLTADWLRKVLIECAVDQENAVDPSDNLRFGVNKDGLPSLNRATVQADGNLLIQALNNLLDNAAKYSYPNNTVEISCGLSSRRKNFYISVVNTGLPIDNEDREQCKKRYWRGHQHQLVVGEGSGIGLWIVDNIMRAHNGELLINPNPLPKNCTEVRLQFPATLRY